MSLKFALLGLIALEPRSGYDIKWIVDSSIYFIWNVTGPQIYVTLRSLRDEGLISTKYVPQRGKPDKQIHSITQSGRVVLEQFANQHIRASVTRDTGLLWAGCKVQNPAASAFQTFCQIDADTRGKV